MVAIGVVGFAVVLAIAMIVVQVLTNGSGRKRHATTVAAAVTDGPKAPAFVRGLRRDRL